MKRAITICFLSFSLIFLAGCGKLSTNYVLPAAEKSLPPPAVQPVENKTATTSKKELPKSEKKIAKPAIVDYFACGDYCPGPREQYMKKVYDGVKDETECLKLGGTPYSFVGWGTVHLCLAQSAKSPTILRGAMIGPEVGETDLQVLAGWGANSIRFPMNWDTFPQSPADSATREQYSAWLAGQLKRLDTLIPICEKLGLQIVIDMHTPVCGRYQDGSQRPLIFKIFRDKTCQQEFLEDWQMIAKKYQNKKIIWGYDLLNEPQEGTVPSEMMNWRQLAEKTIAAIRTIDPSIRIIYEPAVDTLGQDIAQKKAMTPLVCGNVAYSIHMYYPLEFTHQSLSGRPYPIYYPAQIGNTYWDINQQRKLYQPLIDFQKKYNVPIYIGEFSVIRWAPAKDAEQYLSDVITIIEENGWNAAYHSFREWNGWSVEYDSDYLNQKPVDYTTKRKQILLDWYAKN